jgi:hypothetical protein
MRIPSRTKSDWLNVGPIGGFVFGPYFRSIVRAPFPELAPRAGPDHTRSIAVGNVPELK